MQFWNMKLSKPWHLKYLLETKQFPAVTTEVSKVRVSPSSCTNHLDAWMYSTGWGATLPGALWHHCHTKLPLRPSPRAAGRCSCGSCQRHPSVSWVPLRSCVADSSTSHSLIPSGAPAQLCSCQGDQLQPCQLPTGQETGGHSQFPPQEPMALQASVL